MVSIAVFVFVNIYNCTMASYMSVTYQWPEIHSFEDTIEDAMDPSNTYKAGGDLWSIQEHFLLVSDNKIYFLNIS